MKANEEEKNTAAGKPSGLVDVDAFMEQVLAAYADGTASAALPADEYAARGLIPAGTATLRDFSHIAPEIPEFIREKCTGCMDCVTECPDTAILAKVVPESRLEPELSKVSEGEHRDFLRNQFAETVKYHGMPKKKGKEPGQFGLFVDPTKCKGCAECVTVCGDKAALKMVAKTKPMMDERAKAFEFFGSLPDTPVEYIHEKVLADMMLAGRSLLYTGGGGSCMGCGEATAIRMMLAATGYVYGPDSAGIVAATGCNTVYGSTYPYNPFMVPWTNSLFENIATVAMGVRGRWNQTGREKKRLWAIGGDGALLDIGFQALSRMLMSGMDINVLVLDTQVYSNTGGQTSTASFMSQEAKMSYFGKAQPGKTERRKEIGLLSLMHHPDVFVAQTTPAHVNHFYRAVMAANEYTGPSVVNVYTPCPPEHGIGDDASVAQARLAVNTHAFPLLIHDPRQGERLSDRLDLKGNPALKDDWYVNPKTKEPADFISFARTEGRFAKHFNAKGEPSETLLKAQEERLANWRLLQELAGLR
ncbi:MAG: 4Fe-4S binding protein [Acidobacteriota bacterium]|nr:MAG: 4Fe-4S binding protein [Acidobacteriota bacterium]